MKYNKLDIKSVIQSKNRIQRAEQEGRQMPETPYSGLAVLKNFSQGTTSTGNPKVSGILANVEETQFSSWSNTPAFLAFQENDFAPGETIVYVECSVSKFGVVVNNVEPVIDSEFNYQDFLFHRYDYEEVNRAFCDAVNASDASVKAKTLLTSLLHRNQNDYVDERFGKEFAALAHHDNCEHGLIVHTTKCIQIYNGIKRFYSFLQDEVINDLMVVGLALHDIGKIYEMHNGTYQKYSFVTHRGLGCEYLKENQGMICEIYNEAFYYHLLAIIQQHHDEYGEGARTLYAFLVHMIDNMDATFSSIDEMIQNEAYTTDASGTKLRFNDRYLNIYM